MRACRPFRISLEADGHGPGPSFEAFNQTWDEGWELTVDGVAAPLFRVDISLAGFVVPPGRHRIDIAYDDPWITAGAMGSVVSLLGCLLLVWLGRRRRSSAVPSASAPAPDVS